MQALAIDMYKVANLDVSCHNELNILNIFNELNILNLIITYVINLNLSSNRFIVFTMVASLCHIWDLKFGN